MKYGYTRTSTKDKQHDALQRDALLAAGVPAGHIYADQVSGSKTALSRAGWAKLEARLRAGDELVVWRIDRIGRSMLDVIKTVKDLQDRHVVVRSLSDGIDPATREGRLMLNLMATFAEYERELIQERVRAGVRSAQSRGVKFGRPAPDPDDVARKVRVVQHAIAAEGMTTTAAAKLVGWSRSAYYRHAAATSAGSATKPDLGRH